MPSRLRHPVLLPMAPGCLGVGFRCFSCGWKAQGRPSSCGEARHCAGAEHSPRSRSAGTATLPGPSLITLQCHRRERGAGEPGVPGRGPRPCRRPRVSTRPRGPQEMAVLCHGRCPLLTPGSRPSPGTQWPVGTGLAGFPGRSPRCLACPWPWLGLQVPGRGAPSPAVPRARAPTSGGTGQGCRSDSLGAPSHPMAPTLAVLCWDTLPPPRLVPAALSRGTSHPQPRL